MRPDECRKGRRGCSGSRGCSERVGWQPLWSARRIHLHLCFVPTNFELLSAATKQNQRQRQAPAWQDMLLPVCLPACHAATLHVLAGGVQVHFAATTARTKRAPAFFIPAQLGAVSHMHTICILISLEWFRQQKTPTNSQSVPSHFPFSSLLNLPLCRTCLHFLLVIMSVSLHHHRRHQRILRCFYLSACLSLSVRPSVRASVCLSILLSRFAKPSSLPLPSTHHTAPLLSCSQLLLQHFSCPARVLCKLCSPFSSS